MTKAEFERAGIRRNCRLLVKERDPRKLGPEMLYRLGYDPISPMQAIRRTCLACAGNSPTEVMECASVTCELWPFRTGKNPWTKPPSEARKAASRRAAAKGRQALSRERDSDAGSALEGSAATPVPATT